VQMFSTLSTKGTLAVPYSQLSTSQKDHRTPAYAQGYGVASRTTGDISRERNAKGEALSGKD